MSDGFPDVLVLLASRNGARWIGAQLDSIAAQEGVRWALHVADDGSTDDTCALVRAFAAAHPGRDIRLSEGGSAQGAAAAFLRLIARDDLPLGPATHVALADQDDIWLPGKLSRGLAMLKAAGDGPAIYGAQSLHITEDGRPCGRSRRPDGALGLETALLQNLVSGHSLMLNPAALRLARAAGLPPGIAWHDWWLGQLVLACGGQAVIDGETVLLYRQHGQNTLGAPAGLAAALARIGGVLRGDYAGWIRAHLAALENLPRGEDLPQLTPGAAAIIAALRAAPRAGPGRAALFRRLGLRRQGRRGALVAQALAWLGLA
jgi:glycosyltransferase involved in cell wall biosynthesis